MYYLLSFCDWFDFEMILRPITPANWLPSECETTWNLSMAKPFLNALNTTVARISPSCIFGKKIIILLKYA